MNNRYIQIALLVIIAALVLFFLPRAKQEPTPITSFEQCEQAGGEITVSGDTRTCTAPTGECCFTQNVPTNNDDDEIVDPSDTPAENADVIVDTPAPGALVESPLEIKARARGTWFFEANIPVTLKDTSGKVLAQKGVMTSENWMTTDHVGFETTLTFEKPTTQYGVLIISKDNPSGLPQNSADFVVPVRFW